MIKHVKGNLLKAKEVIKVHQVHCMGDSYGGLAGQIMKKYPEVEKQTLQFALERKNRYSEMMGECQLCSTSDGNIYANLYGQYDHSVSEVCSTNYEMLHLAMMRLRDFMEDNDINEVAFPYLIGCALGGGDWKEVYRMIDEVFEDMNVTLYEFNPR